MSRRLIRALLALLLVAPIPTRAADPSQPSDAILRQRGQPQGELQIAYQKEVGGKEQPIALGLAADYDYADANGVRSIHDYKLRRLLTVGPDRAYVDNSLYALVWHRVAEMQNRAGLMKAVSAAKIDAAKLPPVSSDPFWMESDLGVIDPALPRPEIARSEEGGWIRWTVKGEEVAAVKFAADFVPTALRPGLRRFWGELLTVHPTIVDAIAASGRLPEELRFRMMTVKGAEDVHWLLKGAKWVASVPYPLAAGLVAGPAETKGAFPEIFHTLAVYSAEKRVPPTESVYAGRASAAIDRGAGLEGMLWLMEMQLASGSARPADCHQPISLNPFCKLAPLAAASAKADPRFAQTFAPQAPSLADRHKFDDLPNGYLAMVLFANKPAPKDVSFADNEAGLLAGIKAAPVANFCKDVGDFYMRSWNPMAAWQVMDLGRSLEGHKPGDLLSQIDRMEASLAQKVPQFF